jgi:hypothetical protein
MIQLANNLPADDVAGMVPVNFPSIGLAIPAHSAVYLSQWLRALPVLPFSPRLATAFQTGLTLARNPT